MRNTVSEKQNISVGNHEQEHRIFSTDSLKNKERSQTHYTPLTRTHKSFQKSISYILAKCNQALENKIVVINS